MSFPGDKGIREIPVLMPTYEETENTDPELTLDELLGLDTRISRLATDVDQENHFASFSPTPTPSSRSITHGHTHVRRLFLKPRRLLSPSAKPSLLVKRNRTVTTPASSSRPTPDYETDVIKGDKTYDPYPRAFLSAAEEKPTTTSTTVVVKDPTCPSAPRKRSRLGFAAQMIADRFIRQREEIVAHGFFGQQTEDLGFGSFMNAFKVTQADRKEDRRFPLYPKTFVVKVFKEEFLSTKPGLIRAEVEVALKTYKKLQRHGIPVARIYNEDTILTDGYIIFEFIENKTTIQKKWARDPLFNPVKFSEEEKIIFSQIVRIFQQCYKAGIAADLLIDNFQFERDAEGHIRVVLIDVLGQSEELDSSDKGYLNTCLERFIRSMGMFDDKTNPPKVVQTRNQHVYNALLNTPDPETGTVDLQAQRVMPEIIFT